MLVPVPTANPVIWLTPAEIAAVQQNGKDVLITGGGVVTTCPNMQAADVVTTLNGAHRQAHWPGAVAAALQRTLGHIDPKLVEGLVADLIRIL